MNMKKKALTLCLALALSATAVVGGTLAYFTDTDQKDNVFTVGNVDIELTEPEWEKTGKVDAETVYAGEPLDKDPTVTNNGANPCFVRLSVSGLDQFGEKGMIEFRNANYEVGKLNDGWTKYGDYYYYNGILDKDATTEKPLFSSIVMPTGLTGGEEAKSIVVKAEAVQAQGAKESWADVQNMTVEEIAAWFDTCMK